MIAQENKTQETIMIYCDDSEFFSVQTNYLSLLYTNLSPTIYIISQTMGFQKQETSNYDIIKQGE